MPARSSSGLLVSDRIRPPSKEQRQKGKGKGKAPTPEPPRSRAVRILEARLDGARTSNGLAKDPKGGCFCQARNHALSSYATICRHCGLILCTLNPPYYACPHCASPLSDPREWVMLVERLERELAEQLAREEAAQQRAIEEARTAEGAFPMLQAQMQTLRTTPPPSATRTVLSLNSGTGRVTVSSYTTPPLSRPASRGEDREEEEGRVGPPKEVSNVKELMDSQRPWRNVRAGDVMYISLSGGTPNKQGREKKGGRGPVERDR